MRQHFAKNTKTLRNASFAFAATFLIVVFSGIIVIGIVALLSGTPNDSESILSVWDVIPEAGQVKNTAISEKDNAGNVAEIPEGDEGYSYFIKTKDKDTVTIGFAGDILFDENYAVGEAFKKHGDSVRGVFGKRLLSEMKNVDVMLVNNEFPYSTGGEPTPDKTYTFRARPETTKVLKEMGVDMVSLANNHAYDYGEQALVDSFDALKNAGVIYGGAGRNIEEASHPIYYFTENGMKIAIICATQIERLSNPDTKEATETSPGVFRCLDDSLLLDRIREARAKNAYVVVFIHWGTESTTEIDYLQRDQAVEIADAGANLIIGSHPHVLQPIDYVKGVPVVYSLGNYIFTSKTQDTCMVKATFSNDGNVNLQFIPGIQQGCTVFAASGEEKTRIMDSMRSMSPGINMDEKGNISSK